MRLGGFQDEFGFFAETVRMHQYIGNGRASRILPYVPDRNKKIILEKKSTISYTHNPDTSRKEPHVHQSVRKSHFGSVDHTIADTFE